MLISLVANFLISLIILGYSYFFKIIFLGVENSSVKNLDFLYGVFFLILISILFNFFLPLNSIKFFLSISGIILFIISIFKKKILINYIGLLFFLFVFSFFTYWNGNNADSPVYHLQTINWVHDYKISFGLAILDWHYALNSVWHIFLSALSFQYKSFNTLYTLGFIPFSFILLEIINSNKNFKISYVTLFLSLSFLLFFSFVHPFRNGIIFNHLGNPEVDTIGMIFFIITGYIFLKYLETKNKNEYYLLVLSSIICPLIKLTYIGAIIFPVVALFVCKKKISTLFNSVTFLSIFLGVFWILRNFILSSCLLFPFKMTCVNTSWSLSKEQVSFYLNQTKSFARDTPLREKYTNFDYTIHSNDWFLPWVKEYFFQDAFLKISFFIFLFSIILYFLLKLFFFLKNKNFKIEKLFYYALAIYSLNFFIWFQAPEIRFGWGILIFFPCLFLSLLLVKFNIFKKIKFDMFIPIILILNLLLVYKNYKYFELKNLIQPYNKLFNYTQILKIAESNDLEIFKSKNWMCADFKGICVNKPKKNYLLEMKNSYLFIKTTDTETF